LVWVLGYICEGYNSRKKVKASVNTEGLFSTLIKGGKSKGFFLLITVRERG